MKQILKEAFDKANDIVTRYERYQITLREKVDMLDDLSKETETKIKNSMIVVSDGFHFTDLEIWKSIKIVLLKIICPTCK